MKTYNNFLQDLLSYESGIKEDLFDYYINNFDKNIINYPLVMTPGIPIRNPLNGNPIFTKQTIKQYFESLGVINLFDKKNKNCIKNMQYSSINYLGFIGYQFGEAILIKLGYYKPSTEKIKIKSKYINIPTFYIGSSLQDNEWKGGLTKKIVGEGENICLATSSNMWKGSFTGKNNINNIEDLRSEKAQTLLINELIQFNLSKLSDYFEEIELSSYTISGYLAAAHLCGIENTISFIKNGVINKDELNTPITKYLIKFSHYQIQYYN